MTEQLYDPAPCYQLIPGWSLGPTSCTCCAGVVATDRNTFGKTVLNPRQVRAATGDTSGGTTVGQVDDAIAKLTGDDNLATGYWDWSEVDALIATEGKGFMVAMLYKAVQQYGAHQIAANTPQSALVTGQEHGFDGWHAELWHCWLQPGESRVVSGKQLRNSSTDERGLVVYDPLCDGRRPTVALGPVVYPESLVRKIVADSHLAGTRLYGAVTLDARYEVTPPPVAHQPKTTLKWSGQPIYRDLTLSHNANVRSRPVRNARDPHRYRIGWKPKGEHFHAYQVTHHGTEVAGSRTWFGDRGGDRWIAASRFEGGL
jgi:hypothetical protein